MLARGVHVSDRARVPHERASSLPHKRLTDTSRDSPRQGLSAERVRACTHLSARAQERNPKPETRNPTPETRNPKPETRNTSPHERNWLWKLSSCFPDRISGTDNCRHTEEAGRGSSPWGGRVWMGRNQGGADAVYGEIGLRTRVEG